MLISAVTPRPIAFVASQDKDGRGNLAPFSVSFGEIFSVGEADSADDSLDNVDSTSIWSHTSKLFFRQSIEREAGKSDRNGY